MTDRVSPNLTKREQDRLIAEAVRQARRAIHHTNDPSIRVAYSVETTIAPWGGITGTPTTIAGYGITDAYTKTETDALDAAVLAAAEAYADAGDATTLATVAAIYLPLTGGTLTGNLLFSADNAHDIGASGATRPRTAYVGTQVAVGGVTSTLYTSSLPVWARAGSGATYVDANGLLNVIRLGIGSITMTRVGTSVDAPTQSPANSAHGDLVWQGIDDTGAMQQLAFIRGASLNSAITSTSSGGWFDMRATPVGQTTPRRTMSVFGSGGVVIGSDITGSNDPAFGPATLYIERDTGSAAITPSRVIFGSRKSASDWDVTNPWGKLDWHSTDSTGPGEGVRGQVGVGMATTAGSSTWMHIALSTTTNNADNGSGTYQRVASFWGNSKNVRIGSTLTDPGLATGSLKVDGDVVVGTDPGGSNPLRVGGASFLAGSVTFATDNTYDIGASGATRPRTGYFGTSVFTPFVSTNSATDLLLKRNSVTQLTLGNLTATFAGDLVVTTKFGCNGATAQAAYASGGALAAYATGGFGLDSDAHMSALHALVVNMRAALVANGIMS